MGKRLFDVAVALMLVPFAGVIIAVSAIVIRIDSPGNPIFVQSRLGRHQRPFRCYKLRTMFRDTRNAASHLVGTSQITRVGQFLRATKIDELPQLLNVLTGDMSFVGPRPGLPEQKDLTDARSREGVFEATPGITGLAQVSGIDMSEPDRLAKVDRIYIETRTLLKDIRLMLQTATGSGQGDAAGR